MNVLKLLRQIKGRLYRSSRPSLNRLDREFGEFVNFRNGFFIEAGANDGYSQSNTYFLEKKRAWKGILIEGIPELYQTCKKRRTQSLVINCALVSNEFPHKSVEMHFANLMSVVEGSLKTEEAQKSQLTTGVDIQDLDGTYSILVPARTLESILDEIPELPQIDFFSLDVEGYELNVLKGMNLSKYRPRYILVEARFFDEVNVFLESQKYKMIKKCSGSDFLYQAEQFV